MTTATVLEVPSYEQLVADYLALESTDPNKFEVITMLMDADTEFTQWTHIPEREQDNPWHVLQDYERYNLIHGEVNFTGEIGSCEWCYMAEPEFLFTWSGFRYYSNVSLPMPTSEKFCYTHIKAMLELSFYHYGEQFRSSIPILGLRNYSTENNTYIPAPTLKIFETQDSINKYEKARLNTPKCEYCNKPMLTNPYEPGNIRERWNQSTDIEGSVLHIRCTFECTDCNETFSSHDRCVINGTGYCIPCGDELDTWACYSCEEVFTNEYTSSYWSDYRSELYCNSCYSSITIECDNCGDEYHPDEDDHYCEEIDESSYAIHSYSYRPHQMNFWHDNAVGSKPTPNVTYMGIELEVEVSGDRRYEVAEWLNDLLDGRAYLKEDGSLNNGFEIVTHPHSLLEYHNNFPWKHIAELANKRVRSWNTSTCGLHVHIGRTAFNKPKQNGGYRWTEEEFAQYKRDNAKYEAHLIRFNKFIYDNQRQVQRIAGRSSNYASFSDKGKIIPKVKTGGQTNGRYSAVNLDNEATVEVRVFKGSLRIERVLSSIEFCHAAVEYTRNLKISTKDKPFSWVKFVSWLDQHSDTYSNLLTIISESFDKDTVDDGGNN